MRSDRIRLTLRERSTRVVLISLFVIALSDVALRTVTLIRDWQLVQQTWLAPEYRILFGSPVLRLSDYLFRFSLICVALGLFYFAVAAFLPVRKQHDGPAV